MVKQTAENSAIESSSKSPPDQVEKPVEEENSITTNDSSLSPNKPVMTERANSSKTEILDVQATPKKKHYFRKVPTLDIVLSIKQLSIMLKSSLAIEDAFRALAEQTENQRLRQVFSNILEGVKSGMSVADSMSKHKDVFPKIVISIINAGEQGGSLEKNLIYLADYIKRDYEMKKKVKGALFYPIFILVFTFAELLGVMLLIIPKLESLFAGFNNLPVFTRMVMGFSKLLRTEKWFFVGGALLIIIFNYFFFKSQVGQKIKDKISLRFPIIKHLVRQSILANFSRTLGILLESGLPLISSLTISSDTVSSLTYQNAIKKITEEVKSGKNLAEALEVFPNLFPPTFTKLIEIGEQTAALEGNLDYLHEFYSEEVNDMTNNLTTLLEPILLVFIGLMIGALALSIVVPIYQLTGSIGN